MRSGRSEISIPEVGFWSGAGIQKCPVLRISKTLIVIGANKVNTVTIPKKAGMSTQTLRSLEERLMREAPAINWSCEPVSASQNATGTDLPDEIQVRASRQGVPVKGSPFYLSGECLRRWGVDTSANLICNELTPVTHAAYLRTGMDWDRLAEI